MYIHTYIGQQLNWSIYNAILLLPSTPLLSLAPLPSSIPCPFPHVHSLHLLARNVHQALDCRIQS